jgi:hypothetical protein
MNIFIPVASLITAILAVFVGPVVTWKITNHQMKSSLRAANKQIVAPIKQAWINNLRDLVAEISSSILYCHNNPSVTIGEEQFKNFVQLEGKIALMLNFSEDEHKKLHDLIVRMLDTLYGKVKDDIRVLHAQVFTYSRNIIQKELKALEKEIPTS